MTPTVTTSNTALAQIAAKSLPSLSGSPLTYDAARNAFIADHYTSAAGNTYYRTIRMSPSLAVYYEIGEGWYTNAVFLNGIKLYCWDGTHARLIAQRNWGGCFNYRFFSEYDARETAISMLRDFLESQAQLAGVHVSDNELSSYARRMIDETQCKQIG